MERSAEGQLGADALGYRLHAENARRFLEISNSLFAIGTPDGSLRWVNAEWERLLGIDREEMLGSGYLDLLHPDDRARTVAALEDERFTGSTVQDFENRYRTADGSYRVLRWNSVADERTGLVYGVAKDVTDIHESREALAESRRRLAEAQRISRLGSWTWDPETGEVEWSDALYDVFGLDRTEYEPTFDSHLELIHPESVEAFERFAAELRESGGPDEVEYRVRSGRGELVVLARGKAIAAADGRKLIGGICQDVTDVRRAELELARSISLHEATLEATADGVLVVDTEGHIVAWNTNFVEMWRIPEEIVREREDEKMLAYVLEQLTEPDEFLERVRDLYAHPQQESFDVLEFKDGRILERYSAPQRLEGEVVGRVWSFRDVTDRLRAERENLALEARLQQSQRLESLGRLAGGIAHDFNNHLVAILNYAQLAGAELSEGTAARADLDEVIRAAERASVLTRELVAFSRQEMVEPRPLLVNSLITESERLLRSMIGEEIELRVALGRDMPAVEVDPSQLERVLVNLAVNARDAMPDGGTLAISTEVLTVAAGSGDDGLDGEVVRLRVRDDGVGMSEEVTRRAFEPFFTTKPSGEGTGLGLATAYGIVSQSGGQISIESAPGKGTTVTVDLPASEKAPRKAEPAASDRATAARGTVLVVEDEAPVRRLSARLLRDAGYVTLEAENGEEAISVLRETDDELRLLLTDIVMPRMSGRELAERTRGTHPDLPVLFMSGYTDDVVVRHGVATADLPFLSKPFTRETLLAAVSEAIEAGVRPLS